ncbi:hypothetical protein BKA81DRAFT_140161 [Phyllosticta paracitricarpa]|uniref:Uncharacterized protein n=1 Tax=Phyllosticta paracitricarpa TaxID=2016321 RepID=A0ABR1NCT7_9PEZI
MASERLLVCSLPPRPALHSYSPKFPVIAQLVPHPLQPADHTQTSRPNQLRRLRACLKAKHPNRGKISRIADYCTVVRTPPATIHTKNSGNKQHIRLFISSPFSCCCFFSSFANQKRARTNTATTKRCQEAEPLSSPSADGNRHPCPGRPATALPGTLPTYALLRRPPPRLSRPAPPPKRACCYARETGGDREGVGESQSGWRQGRVFACFFWAQGIFDSE